MVTDDPLFLDDIAVGDVYETGEVVITEADIIAFASQFDPQVFHLDPEAARSTYFGGLAASGWHTAALTMRLLVTSGLPLANGLIGAGAEVSWPTATRPGDTLHVRSVVTAVTPSRSRPDRGFIVVESDTFAQDGAIRQHFVAKLLVFRREENHATE